MSDISWDERVKITLSRIRKMAIKTNEPRDITLAKLDAVRNHCHNDGDFAKCKIDNTIRYIRIG